MKHYKPTSPGRRGMTSYDYKEVLTTDRPSKRLTKGFQRGQGRNSAGRITVRHKGGGAKRRFRLISLGYEKRGVPARVATVEYDPNRSSFISLLIYRDGDQQYRLAPKNVNVGDTVVIAEDAPLKPGNATMISRIPTGMPICNLELKPGGGGRVARGAGESAEVVAQEAGRTLVRMPSKEVRYIPSHAWATVGSLTKEEHRYINFGKAGRSRHKGIRPTVRGTAMNPVDHPHGGGEGSQPMGLRRPKNMWGKGTRGVKTRRPKKYSNVFILERRPKTKRKK